MTCSIRLALESCVGVGRDLSVCFLVSLAVLTMGLVVGTNWWLDGLDCGWFELR
jgi:hypothetical protein